MIIGGVGKKRTPALAAAYADEFNLPFVDERHHPRPARPRRARPARRRARPGHDALVQRAGASASAPTRRSSRAAPRRSGASPTSCAPTASPAPAEAVDTSAATPRSAPSAPTCRCSTSRPRPPRPAGRRGRARSVSTTAPSTAIACAPHDLRGARRRRSAPCSPRWPRRSTPTARSTSTPPRASPRHLVDHGHDGLVVSGTTGESPTTTKEEDGETLAAVRRRSATDVKLVAGRRHQRHRPLGLAGPAGREGRRRRRPARHALLQQARPARHPAALPPGRRRRRAAGHALRRARPHRQPDRPGVLRGDGRLGAGRRGQGRRRRPAARGRLIELGYALYSGDDVANLGWLAHGAVGFVSVVGHVCGDELRADARRLPRRRPRRRPRDLPAAAARDRRRHGRRQLRRHHRQGSARAARRPRQPPRALARSWRSTTTRWPPCAPASSPSGLLCYDPRRNPL